VIFTPDAQVILQTSPIEDIEHVLATDVQFSPALSGSR